jgi:hypothetical protein
MNLEELQKKLDENTDKIMHNLKKIEHNANKIDANSEKIQQNSVALDVLKEIKGDTKMVVAVLIVVLVMWFATIGYLVYVLNDIGVEEETTITQDNENGYNNYIGNDGDIINGKTNN